MLALLDSFDHYSNFAAQCHPSWSYVPGTSAMVAGRNGGQAIKLSDYADFYVFIPPQAYMLCTLDPLHIWEWVSFGAAIKLDNFDWWWLGSKPIFSLFSGSGEAMGNICVNSAGQLFVQQIVNNTLGISGGSTDQIIAGRWYYVEVHVYINTICQQNASSVKIYLDGKLVSSCTRATWDIHWLSQFYDIIRIRLEGGQNSIAFDDFYVGTEIDGYFGGGEFDDNIMGEQKILALLPTADTAEKQLTPSSGVDNFAMVDDSPGHDGDGTYNSTMEKYLTDMFDHEQLVGMDDFKVNAVQVSAVAKKGVYEGDRYIVPAVNSGGVEVVPFPPSPYMNPYVRATYGTAHTIYVKDPNGDDVDWTVPAVNAAKIGYGV